MNDSQLLERVAAINRYAETAPLPDEFGTREAALHEIERRVGMDTRDTERKATTEMPSQEAQRETLVGETPPHSRRWSGPWLAAAVFIAILGAVGLFALLSYGSDGDDVATQPEVDESPAIVAEALATAEEYYDAFNAGDLEGMRALFAPGIEMQQGPGALTLGNWEKQTTFFIAEGGAVEVAECTAEEVVTGVAEVTCPFGDRSSPIDAVDATPVPVVATLRIDDTGIIRIDESADLADYRIVADPFEAWVAEFHPEDTQAASCCAFFSVEEAQERGELRRQYAEEWAAWLEENGCVWDEPCEP